MSEREAHYIHTVRCIHPTEIRYPRPLSGPGLPVTTPALLLCSYSPPPPPHAFWAHISDKREHTKHTTQNEHTTNTQHRKASVIHFPATIFLHRLTPQSSLNIPTSQTHHHPVIGFAERPLRNPLHATVTSERRLEVKRCRMKNLRSES